jgi:hypothetical protein
MEALIRTSAKLKNSVCSESDYLLDGYPIKKEGRDVELDISSFKEVKQKLRQSRDYSP